MRTLNKREKIIAGVCLAFCLLFFGKQAAVAVFVDYQDELDNRVDLVKEKIAKARVVMAREPALQARIKDLSASIGTVTTEGAEMARGASRMEEVAGQVGVRIINVQPRTVRQEKFFSVIAVNQQIINNSSLAVWKAGILNFPVNKG